MNQVTVRFIGICTHFSQSTLARVSPSTSLPKQRVVLVNAQEGGLVHGMWIPPHSAVLNCGGELIPLPATVRLRTASPTVIPPELTDTFKALPNLSKLVAGLTTLGDPAPEVVIDQDLKHSACYFDIDFGTLSACSANGIAATLDVESADPITLEVTPWDGSSPSTSPPLPSGTVITVSNVDIDAMPGRTTDLADFLLHYKTAAKMPHIPQVPQEFLLPRCSWDAPTIGAGCSNSNYP